MQNIKAISNDHRLSRFIAWGQAMVAWLAVMLSSDAAPKRRHIRRYAMIELMPRFVECILIIRAAALAFPRGFTRKPRRPANAPTGFTRVTPSRAQTLHAAIGLRMRRRLRPRGLAARFAILCDALRNIDAYAAPLVARARRRLTRLTPLIPIRPPQAAACAAPALSAPQRADTS